MGDSTPTSRSVPGQSVEYVGPDTYILFDAAGQPQPVPGMTYEDFLAAWKQANAPAANRQPRFTIEQVDVTGAARDQHAEITLRLSFRLLIDGPVAVPLGIGNVIFREPPKFEPSRNIAATDGDAETSLSPLDFLEFDTRQASWTAWLHGRSGDSRTLEITALVPLVRDGNAVVFSLATPRAATNRLHFDLPGKAADVSLEEGLIESQSPATERTRLEATWPGGQLQLRWHSAAAVANEFAIPMTVASASRLSIKGNRIATTSRFRSTAVSGAFDRLRIQLPRGSRLAEDPPAAGGATRPYQVSLPPPESASAATAPPPVAVVEFAERQTTAVVDLALEQPLPESLASVELTGPTVVGAVRHTGDLALDVDDAWQVRWDSPQHLRQVDPGDLDAYVRQADISAAFQFDAQPWSLRLQLSPKQLRVYVLPVYDMECLVDEVRLRVRLAYQVLGARASEFRVDLKGWELSAEPIESNGAIDRERAQVTEDGLLVLPLAQPSTRRAEITFVARRAAPASERTLSLPLPLPLVESVGTGELTVRPSTGEELTPDPSRIVGLTPIPISDAPAGNQPAAGAALRYHGSPRDALFVAERVRRPREVSTRSMLDIRFPDEAPVEWEQRIEYNVRFQPLQDLQFDLPAEVPFDFSRANFELLDDTAGDDADSQSVSLKLLDVPPAGDTSTARRRVRLSLPQPRVGRFVVRATAQWDHPAAALPAAVAIPLFVPAEGGAALQQVAVHPKSGWELTLDRQVPASWRLENGSSSDNTVEFKSSRAEPALLLVARRAPSTASATTFLQRTWLQTWIAGDVRQDRIAFRFQSTSRFAAVELPPAVNASELEVLLDAAPVVAVVESAGRLTIPLPAAPDAEPTAGDHRPASPAAAEHTLELRYRQPVRPPLVARLQFTPPQLVATTSLSELYWQIVLPADQHILVGPRLTPDREWQWLGAFYGRRPAKTQSELESWAHASQGFHTTTGQSEYLYRGLTSAGTIEFVVAPRWLIVFAASATVLLLALLAIYVPALRRGPAMIALLVVLAVLAIAFPALAMLVGQASLLGVGFAIIAAWIARYTSRLRPTSPSTIHVATQRSTLPRSDGSPTPPVVSASNSTSATVLRVGDPAS